LNAGVDLQQVRLAASADDPFPGAHIVILDIVGQLQGILDNTVQDLVCVKVIRKAGIYRIISLSKKQALTFLESITVSTKAHPNPPFPIEEKIKTPVQTNIRRSAINRAYGMVKSYVSNLKNWYKEGKELGHKKPSYPNPKNFSLTYYATDVELQNIFLRDRKELHFVRLKVLSESGNYRKRNYPVKVYKRLLELIDSGYIPQNTATLIKKEENFYVAITLEKEIKSVANVTRQDVTEFLDLAARIPIIPEIQKFSLQEANKALLELKERKIRGAKVLMIS